MTSARRDILPNLTSGACATGSAARIFQNITVSNTSAAVEICNTCPVKTMFECRRWAIVHEDSGVWGGLSKEGLRAHRIKYGIRLEHISEGEIAPRTITKKAATP